MIDSFNFINVNNDEFIKIFLNQHKSKKARNIKLSQFLDRYTIDFISTTDKNNEIEDELFVARYFTDYKKNLKKLKVRVVKLNNNDNKVSIIFKLKKGLEINRCNDDY